MKRICCFCTSLIFLAVCILGIQTATAKTLYDDFSGDYLDSSKWRDQEFVREVYQDKLLLNIRNSITNEHAYHQTLFNNPELITSSIQCDISVKEANLDSGTDPLSFVRIQGFFYNAQNSGGATGDVVAIIYLGNRGSGLEAWWEVYEVDNDERSSFTEIESGTLVVPGLVFGTSYTALLEYDGDHGFTFTVGGVSASFNAGPAKLGDVVTQHKGFRTGAYTTGGAGNGYVSATIDNVLTDGTAYDDFSTAPLDQTKWQALEFVRELDNGKLRLATHGTDNTENNRINFVKPFNYTEGIVTIKSDSVINAGARGRTRISGEFYNDTYGPGEYNGYEGDVYAQIYINHYDDNTLEAKCYVEKATNADWSTYQELYSHAFSLPIDFDKPYKLSIHFKGTSFVFKVIDIGTSTEEFYEYPVSSDVNLASQPNVQIISRVYGNGSSGYMSVEWDDIYVDTAAAPATYDAVGEWGITTSNEWANGTCSVPDNSPGTGKITQTGSDVTLVVNGSETLNGWVFSNKYYLTQTLTDPNNTEIFYVRLNLSSATAGSGTVVIKQTEGNDVCYKGWDIVFTKTADAPADDPADAPAGGGGGGGGGGCFISIMNK